MTVREPLVTYENPKFHEMTSKEMRFSRDFTTDEFKQRRQRMQKEIGPNAYLLLPSGPPNPSVLDYMDAKFYYTCGLEINHGYLFMNGADGHTTLFLPSRDAMGAGPEESLGFEDASYVADRLGVDDVKSLDDMGDALTQAKTIFIPFVEVEGGGAGRFASNRCAKIRAETFLDQAESDNQRTRRLLEEHVPGVTLEDATPIFDHMRSIKSPAEIEIMRQTSQLNALVMIEAMKATRAGLSETRLHAIAEFIFRDQGYCGLGYEVIAAVGSNTMDGHYCRNNTMLKDGEMILMDCGPDLRHYTSDIARCWPVSGTYTEPFGNVYGFICEYHKTLMTLIKPGVIVTDVYDEAAAIMRHMVKQPDFRYGDQSVILEQMIEKGINYLNHSVGMSVHDPAPGYREKPLQEGFIGALDPMVWLDDEKYYIRVEDTIVVTSDGCESLTGAAPFEIDDVEALMKEPSSFTL